MKYIFIQKSHFHCFVNYCELKGKIKNTPKPSLINHMHNFLCSFYYPKTQFTPLLYFTNNKIIFRGWKSGFCRIQFICPSIHKLSTHRHIILWFEAKKTLLFFSVIKTELILIENVKSINCVIHKTIEIFMGFLFSLVHFTRTKETTVTAKEGVRGLLSISGDVI